MNTDHIQATMAYKYPQVLAVSVKRTNYDKGENEIKVSDGRIKLDKINLAHTSIEDLNGKSIIYEPFYALKWIEGSSGYEGGHFVCYIRNGS